MTYETRNLFRLLWYPSHSTGADIVAVAVVADVTLLIILVSDCSDSCLLWFVVLLLVRSINPTCLGKVGFIG